MNEYGLSSVLYRPCYRPCCAGPRSGPKQTANTRSDSRHANIDEGMVRVPTLRLDRRDYDVRVNMYPTFVVKYYRRRFRRLSFTYGHSIL
jgi:hypothetical protein